MRTRKRPEQPLPAGFLNVDKPSGVTSHDVVDFVRRLTGDRRVGHCGTLDPRARGVLPLCIGSATRLADHLVAARKSYRAVARLDVLTDTADLDGQITARFPGAPSREAVEAALARFRGSVRQEVPAYSAVRVGGERLHELARAGVEVERPVRDVLIDELDLLAYEWPVLELAVVCSKGTYIRQLAVDVGAALGVGGALDELVRTAVGALTLDRAWTPAHLAGAWIRDDLTTARVPWETALGALPRLHLTDPSGELRLKQGAALAPSQLSPAPTLTGPAMVMDDRGEPLALCEVLRAGAALTIQPRKVFVP
jgi:tRNA pseudouridine55 synthase